MKLLLRDLYMLGQIGIMMLIRKITSRKSGNRPCVSEIDFQYQTSLEVVVEGYLFCPYRNDWCPTLLECCEDDFSTKGVVRGTHIYYCSQCWESVGLNKIYYWNINLLLLQIQNHIKSLSRAWLWREPTFYILKYIS